MLKFIFLKILFMSIGMSVSGLILMSVTRIKRLLSRQQCYYMWLIPLILAVVPVMVSLPAANIPVTFTGSDTETVQSDNITPAENAVPVFDNVDTFKAENTAAVFEANAEADKLPYQMPDLIFCLAAVYFAGVLITLLAGLVKWAKFHHTFAGIAEPAKLDTLEDAKQRLKIKKNIRVYTIKHGGTPFVYGVFKPWLVIPTGQISDEALLHELTHIKRHDLLYMLFTHAVRAVHFFNPLVYLYSSEIKKLMELSCDEAVSSIMNDSERIAYGKSIVNCASSNTSYGAVCLSENGRNIKERIDVIMKQTKRTKLTALISVVMIAVICISQTAFAAAVNGQSPAKAYAINHTNSVYSVVYRNGDNKLEDGTTEWWYSGRSGLGKNIATLVNTPVYKGFKADLQLTFTDELNNFNDNANKKDASVHIEMTEFIKSVYNGRTWQGKFDVTFNDELVLHDAMGYLNEIPGNGNRDVSRLLIMDGNKALDLEYINFGVKGDERINTFYEDDLAKAFNATSKRYLNGIVKNGENPETNELFGVTIFSNPSTGRLYVNNFNTADNLYISTLPNTTYKFDGDNSATGKFLLKYLGNIVMDEFTGTITGLVSGNPTLVSEDKTINITTSDITESAEVKKEEEGYYSAYPAPQNEFEAGWHSLPYRNIRLSDLPFTMELNKDKTKVIVKLRDNFTADRWYFLYASYIITSDHNVYLKGNSDEGKRVYELDLCPDYGHHNFQFNTLSLTPYARSEYYDVMFEIEDGEIFYSNCQVYPDENKNISGTKALEQIKENHYRMFFDYNF